MSFSEIVEKLGFNIKEQILKRKQINKLLTFTNLPYRQQQKTPIYRKTTFEEARQI